MPGSSIVLSLHSQLGSSAGMFQALLLVVHALWCLVPWINHLPPECLFNIWQIYSEKLIFKLGRMKNSFSLLSKHVYLE